MLSGMGVIEVDSVILALWVQVTMVERVTRNGDSLTIVWKTLVAVRTSPSAALTAIGS